MGRREIRKRLRMITPAGDRAFSGGNLGRASVANGHALSLSSRLFVWPSRGATDGTCRVLPEFRQSARAILARWPA